MLRAAIDEGIAELDAGRGEEMTVAEMMADVRHEVGLAALRVESRRRVQSYADDLNEVGRTENDRLPATTEDPVLELSTDPDLKDGAHAPV